MLLSLGGCGIAEPSPIAAYLSNFDGGIQTVAPGAQAAKPLTVIVRDHESDPMEGVTVTWRITSGGGSLSSLTTSTDDDGKSSVTFTAGTAGTTVIAATVAGLSSVSFTMTVQ